MLVRVGNLKIPKRGDLRSPITIVRSDLTSDYVAPDPEEDIDESGVGFNETVTKIKNIKAQVVRGAGMYSQDGSLYGAMKEIAYIFIVDYDRELIYTDKDYVVYENRYYKIITTRQFSDKIKFVALYTIDDGNFAAREATIAEPEATATIIEDNQEFVAETDNNPFYDSN